MWEVRAADDDGEGLEKRGGEPEGEARPDHAAEAVRARGRRGALGKALGQAFKRRGDKAVGAEGGDPVTYKLVCSLGVDDWFRKFLLPVGVEKIFGLLRVSDGLPVFL